VNFIELPLVGGGTVCVRPNTILQIEPVTQPVNKPPRPETCYATTSVLTFMELVDGPCSVNAYHHVAMSADELLGLLEGVPE
jgi:hypothetical protein